MVSVYLCPGAGRSKAQLAAAGRGYCARVGLDEPVVFADAAARNREPWADRPAARRLLAKLQPGDTLVVPNGWYAYVWWADWVAAIEAVTGRGATLATLQPALTVAPESLELEAARMASRVLEEFRRMRSEDIRDGIARRKAAGFRHCRHPGYGKKWVGPRGRQRLADDPAEQEAIRQIVGWRAEGYSVEQIYYHLRGHGVRTKVGRDWSRNRIRRVCRTNDSVTTCGTLGSSESFPLTRTPTAS